MLGWSTPARPGVLAAHARELRQPLRRGVDGRAGVDEQLGVVTGHRDRHRDRGPSDAVDTADAQQARRPSSAPVLPAPTIASALPLAHGLARSARPTRPSCAAPPPAGSSSIAITSRGSR